MASRTIRTNPAALRWIRAAFVASALAAALHTLPFYPDWIAAVLAIAVFALALWTPAVALLIAVAALAIPVAAADFVAGAALCVIGFALAQALASREAAGSMALLVTLASLPFGAGFAGPVLAGYLFGLKDGPLGAGLGAATAIVGGALLGVSRVGALLTGAATDPVISFGSPPKDPLAFTWLSESIAHAEPARMLHALTSAGPTWVLVAQVVVWAIAAAAASWLRGADRNGSEKLRALAGLLLLTLALAGPVGAVWRAADAGVSFADLARTTGASLVVVAVAGAASEWLFPRVTVKTEAAAPERAASSLRAKEADVDELLRLIATAEEELASRHTRIAAVMLTDLKAFSRMTERLGSVECAKIVQRHRDVLLPIIERHGGKGKPTGGDGLVAAFDSADSAVRAAIEMQEAIERLGGEISVPEALAVRIGIALGEVVVDAGGRPFLGAALNLAARVMGLADGGRIFVSGDVAHALQSDELLHSHGERDLKNIARPVEVFEVLWKPGMEPQAIESHGEEERTSGPEPVSGPDA
ncbi:MAG: adenylate/guanylate cyclase domain-containing protein [Anaerosomatales bacterium]|nr:adenylate/guanylate cyclase domain-containing protein [Anaerosomatales bacterium]